MTIGLQIGIRECSSWDLSTLETSPRNLHSTSEINWNICVDSHMHVCTRTYEDSKILECSLLDLSSPDTLLEIVSGWIQEDLQIFHCTGTENDSMKYQASSTKHGQKQW